MVYNPYFLKNISARSNVDPTIFSANGFPNFRDRAKQMDAPINVVLHDSNPPHKGPKTIPLVIATTLPGRGAMVDCRIIRAADIRTAHAPWSSNCLRRCSTPPAL